MSPAPADFESPTPWGLASLGFLILFMGWMPAPIDVAAWPSLWMGARERETRHRATMFEAMVDFHIGYIGAFVTAVFFLALGALVLHGSGREFAGTGAGFANQLISLYAETIGQWSLPVIAVAAFTTMFSTTLACVDGWPRSLATCTLLARKTPSGNFRAIHAFWILSSVAAAYVIVRFYLTTLLTMLDVAMVVSFLTTPVFAYLNYRASRMDVVPPRYQPGPWLRTLSWLGMIFFISFTLLFLYWWIFMD